MPQLPSKLREIAAANGAPPPRKERLAINLFDLDATDAGLRMMLFGGKLRLDSPIRVDPQRVEETAIELICPLLTAASALDILQSERRKFGENSAKTYINRGSVWVRLPSSVLLTVVKNNKAVLNPAVFGAEVVSAPEPTAPKRLAL